MTPAFRFASTAPIDAPPPADSIHVTDSYTLASGDTLELGGNPGFKLEVKGETSVSLEIDGVATLTAGPGRSKLAGVGTSLSLNGQADVHIGASGALTVELKSNGMVVGVDLEVDGGVFGNDGYLHVVSGGGTAIGAGANLSQKAGGGVLTNTGLIEVEGGQYSYCMVDQGVGSVDNQGTIVARGSIAFGMAVSGSVSATNSGEIDAIGVGETGGGIGVSMNVSASLSNTGKIHASGPSAGLGVWVLGDGVLDNAGKIVASGGAGQSIGALIGINGASTIINDGVLKGDLYGVVAQDAVGPETTVSADSVTNSGKIVGDVLLGPGADSIDNSGRIVGDIDLGDGGDSYEGHGRVEGMVLGGLGDDALAGGRGADILYGDGLADAAGDGDDLLRGLKGDDSLFGGQGADTLTGGAGADTLSGGTGDDEFNFVKVTDSGKAGADLITDLTATDVIDLHAIDAESASGDDQAFHLVASFSGAAGELTVSYDSGSGLTTIAGDTDGDGAADVTITAAGDHHDFTNFVL